MGSLGHAAAFSLCQDKITTTGGEGGMLTTSVPEVYAAARSYCEHVRPRHAASSPPQAPGYCWVYNTIGTNWRLAELQSAIGSHRLRRLSASLQRRRELASMLRAAVLAHGGEGIGRDQPGVFGVSHPIGGRDVRYGGCGTKGHAQRFGMMDV